LKPVLYATDLKWGESTFYHDNWLLRVVTHQWIRYLMVIIQNSVYFLGDQIFDGMAEPVLTKFLWYYQWYAVLPDTFNGQNKWDIFTIDVRNTRKPVIGPGFIDFWFNGEFRYNDEACLNFKDDQTLNFIDTSERSQLVISQSAITCIMNQWSKSSLGQIDINEERFNTFFMVKDYKLNTKDVANHIKLFQEKYGDDLPL